ncbi:MAG: DNA gyrase subunit A [Acidimicrobiales bacterium]
MVEPIDFQEEMERSYLEYSMSVIVSRALPDVRDGLKPVHRRILYSMWDSGLRPDRPHVKCASVVGEVMGKFHPHGDAAIYDALARMVQDFSLRHPLIDGHGDFGAPGPDALPAAMRYTEARLAPLAMSMLEGIDEDTVDFVPNYDGRYEQPVVLPSRFPNLLVNGSQGIAVGMATNVPPHNLGEVIDATLHLIEHPDATPDDLMKFVKGPDFPTRGVILGRAGIIDAYRTGRGSVKIRAVTEVTEARNGAPQIVVSEIPYQTAVEVIEKQIAEALEGGDVSGISAIDNLSAGGQPRLVITLRRDANPNVVLNNLFKHTQLQASFGIHMLALVDGVPRLVNLAQALSAYVAHQVEVVTRRSEFRLRKARERAHIVEGLLRALDMLDQVIATIRGSDDRAAARTNLMAEPFSFSEDQANHILDMTLSRLTRLGRSELEEEMAELKKTIAELESILGHRPKLLRVISDELKAVRDKFTEERRTRVVHDPGDLSAEDLIEDDDLVVTLSRAGYVKAVSTDAFRTQSRGGRGVQGARLKEEDLIREVIYATSLSHLLLFSNRGKVYRLRAHEVPVKERTARGTALVNLISLSPGERIQAIVPTKEFDPDQYLLFATRSGQVKKTSFSEYDKSRREGFIAITLNDDDELVRVLPTSGDDDVFMVSEQGMVIRFNEADVRPMGRSAAGVRGMRLRTGDKLVACDVSRPDVDLVIVTDAGFGKRTKLDRFGTQGRGGQGVRGIKITERRGVVIDALMATIDDELLVVSSAGIVIRMAVREITSQGRDATGVRVMNLEDGQRVTAVALMAAEEE